ncbi:SsrA-binding protein [Candidatus Marinamargulisbacteria bacterium SCGC AG-343-D04]|nr:SsrA-binding protein [Candidatus Marinamargulisbacteria bacterium SCGC AG-343-D04]
MTKKKQPFKIVASNKKAHHNYTIIETLEAGIALKGNEVKSIRKGLVSLKESFARIDNMEIWLQNCHVTPYAEANTFYKIDATRNRKLLLHKKQIEKWMGKAQEKGLTIIATKLYIKHNKVKCEIALAKAKKLYDKRDDIKQKDIKRSIQKEMKRR